MALEVEIERYNELLPEWLPAAEGKFAVIKGRDLLGVFETNSDGYRAGLETFGFTTFLVRPIRAVQPVIDMRNIHLGLIRGRF